MAVQRQAKIERYRQKKMTEERLVEVKKAVDSAMADEEVVRDFYLLTVKKWINIALEEIESIDLELEILKRMDLPSGPRQFKHPQRPPMKPFVLTKDAVQVRPLSKHFFMALFTQKKIANHTCFSNRPGCLELVTPVCPL